MQIIRLWNLISCSTLIEETYVLPPIKDIEEEV